MSNINDQFTDFLAPVLLLNSFPPLRSLLFDALTYVYGRQILVTSLVCLASILLIDIFVISPLLSALNIPTFTGSVILDALLTFSMMILGCALVYAGMSLFLLCASCCADQTSDKDLNSKLNKDSNKNITLIKIEEVNNDKNQKKAVSV